MSKRILFDMDGTLNDFYGVPDWLTRLRSYDPTPYAEAKVALNMSLLARLLNQLQKMGYFIGIVSWLARGSTPTYDTAVTAAKEQWLTQHLKSVTFDAVYIVPYGVPKENYKQDNDDILFDDNSGIREAWGENAFTPDQIISTLKGLVNEG